MLRINEESKWEDEVPLLTRADKVEGGITGASNQQAIILANRTRKLKDDFDSAMDYREYTFTLPLMTLTERLPVLLEHLKERDSGWLCRMRRALPLCIKSIAMWPDGPSSLMPNPAIVILKS